MKHLRLVTLLVTLCILPVLSHAQCVTDKELAIYIKTQMPLPRGGLNTMTAECDPCKCPALMSDCYAFMAGREREKEENNRVMRDIYERYIKYGVCK